MEDGPGLLGRGLNFRKGEAAYSGSRAAMRGDDARRGAHRKCRRPRCGCSALAMALDYWALSSDSLTHMATPIWVRARPTRADRESDRFDGGIVRTSGARTPQGCASELIHARSAWGFGERSDPPSRGSKGLQALWQDRSCAAREESCSS